MAWNFMKCTKNTISQVRALGSRTVHVRCLPRVVAQWSTSVESKPGGRGGSGSGDEGSGGGGGGEVFQTFLTIFKSFRELISFKSFRKGFLSKNYLENHLETSNNYLENDLENYLETSKNYLENDLKMI
ncbi:hypothetical protein PV328_003916 [Microctonus aethiopoides]|uniref:Uncharacterized protein n=1 Tax=Microctonus aethiopoides TaxID=144406 RepID=A0AA39KL16_9HYME|nr:hypothetical protein PV328_003916 [Microctonus aethiopoides]